MQKNFGERTNLEELAKEIAHFFEDRKFEEITAVKTESGSQILVADSQTYKIKGTLQVDIAETLEGFTIDFKHLKEPKKFNFPMTMMTMFGGGYFFLKDLKSDEALIKIEREFWNEIRKMIANSQRRIGETA